MSKVSEMLARVRELDAAATPGPWDWYDVDCRVPPWSIARRIRRGRRFDADLIAEYRTLAPKLAGMLERAMRALETFDHEGYLLAEQALADIEAMAEGDES